MVQKQRSAQSASLIRSSTDQISAVAKLSQSKANDSDNDSRINPQAALLAAIRQRKGPNAARDEVDVVPSEEIASAKPNRLNPHSALLESIRDAKTSVSSGSLAKAAQLSTDKPPRAALLTSIKNATRSKVERNTTNSLSESDKQPIAPYDADKNPFLKSIGTKLSEIQAVYDDIDLKVESMITAWEATARYFGEASTTSSDHVFLLLNRLILDMRTTQLKRHRQRIHHSTFPASLGTFSSTVMSALAESLFRFVEVGHQIVTKYGAGVVLTIRRLERKIEVRFPWSQECFLQPSALLGIGDRVWCKMFGIGFIRETLYSKGFCCVRFPFGFGFIRTSDISYHWNNMLHQKQWDLLTSHELTRHSNFFPGDLVRTPFGIGTVRSISQRRRMYAPKNSSNGCEYVVRFDVLESHEREWSESLSSPQGYCLSTGLTLQYTLQL